MCQNTTCLHEPHNPFAYVSQTRRKLTYIYNRKTLAIKSLFSFKKLLKIVKLANGWQNIHENFWNFTKCCTKQWDDGHIRPDDAMGWISMLRMVMGWDELVDKHGDAMEWTTHYAQWCNEMIWQSLHGLNERVSHSMHG